MPTSLIYELAQPEELAKYRKFALRSFVEDNKAMSWCTAASCENAVGAWTD